MNTHDVAVVGRGAIGSAAALGFARAGWRVALVAPAPASAAVQGQPPETGLASPSQRPSAASSDDWDQRVYALSSASRRLLMDLGVWQSMDHARIAPIHDMRIFNLAGSSRRPPPEVHLDAYHGRVEALAWIVENRQLQGALDRAIAATLQPSRLQRIDAEVESLTLPLTAESREGASLRFAGGGRLSTRLVIAADGTGSRLRELAGIDHVVRDYEQTAVVANFEAGLPHRDCAWQWFGDFGVVALLPLPSEDLGHGRSRVSLVWSAPREAAAIALGEDGAALAARVEAMTERRLGDLRMITPAAGFALRTVRCRQVIKPAFVLIGDAAHAVHPMAGQGMNLGFADVQGLLRHVAVRNAGSAFAPAPVGPAAARFGFAADPGVTAFNGADWYDLRRYERSRREQVATMQLALDGLYRAFGKLPAPLVGLRDIGWSVVARSAWLRRRMIDHAVS
jgi:ubiquinone biosynthesis UbiH/UbiF/VisC/COQ6 family hydroxylase